VNLCFIDFLLSRFKTSKSNERVKNLTILFETEPFGGASFTYSSIVARNEDGGYIGHKTTSYKVENENQNYDKKTIFLSFKS